MLRNNQHIVFLIPGFPKNEEDDTCIPAVFIFMKAWQKQWNGKISVITFQYPFQSKLYSWFGIDVYPLNGKNKNYKKQYTWHKAKSIFKKIYQNEPVNFIHSFWMGECAMIGNLLSKKYQLPHTCTLMGQDVRSENRYFKKITPLPRLIALSQFHLKELKTNHQLNALVIPWGIEQMSGFNGQRSIDVIGIGSLIQLKGYRQFIDIISKVKKDFPYIKAQIVGDGPLFNELQQKIIELNLQNNIQLRGKLKREMAMRLLSQSKVFMHLSEFESYGMVIVEALAFGTHVISKRVGIASTIQEVIHIKGIDDAAIQLIAALKNNHFQPQIVSVHTTVEMYKTYYFQFSPS